MKHILVIFSVFLFLFSGCTQNVTIGNEINVKYRETPVDVSATAFEELDTSKSSWISGAWYDKDNEYMIINLNGINYQYCGLPEDEWASFKMAESFGSYYNANIKGNYACRTKHVPIY